MSCLKVFFQIFGGYTVYPTVPRHLKNAKVLNRASLRDILNSNFDFFIVILISVFPSHEANAERLNKKRRQRANVCNKSLYKQRLAECQLCAERY